MNQGLAPQSGLILRTATLVIMPLQLLFSIFLLLRGHNEPGGGFIGGLVAAGALSLYLIVFGAKAARRLILIDPKDILAWGLIFGLLATVPAVFLGQAFFTAQWLTLDILGTEVKLSTVLVFDIGVYLAVIGTITTMFFALSERLIGSQ